MSGWTNTAPTSITAPSTAVPGDARIVLGSQVPAAIQTIAGLTITAAILWYDAAPADDRYHFYAIASGGTIIRGDVAGAVVAVIDQTVVRAIGGGATWTIGSISGGASQVRMQLIGTRLEISDAANGPSSGPFFIDGVSAPRGTRAYVSGGVAASTGPEVTVSTSDVAVFRANRAYRVRLRAHVVSTLAGQAYQLRVRTAGGSLGLLTGVTTTQGETKTDEFVAINVTGFDISSALSLTVTGGTAANTVRVDGTGTLQAEVEAVDVGAAGAFVGATNMV